MVQHSLGLRKQIQHYKHIRVLHRPHKAMETHWGMHAAVKIVWNCWKAKSLLMNHYKYFKSETDEDEEEASNVIKMSNMQ